ncbi:MAG: MFS transporter, partial [Actinomycetota bacterium]
MGPRVLIGVILTGTLSVLDSTLVVPLLTTIGADFGGGSEVSWLVAGYLLTSTVTIPLWGRWLDLRGERDVMWAALAVFLAGTVVSLSAPSLEILIVGRLIQGVGVGGLVPVGQAILAGRCTSPER